MRRKLLVGALVLAGFTGVYFFTRATMDQTKTPSQIVDPAPVANEQPTSKKIQGYRVYSEADLAKTDGQRVVLFFHAPWCPICRSIEDNINQQTVSDDVVIFKVDYDSNQALRQKYGVTIQTTFVQVDASGNELKQWQFYEQPNAGVPEIEAKLEG